MQGSDAMWVDADSYEAYIGRWSRIAAMMFVDWLGLAPRSAWLDVGSGTGALTQAILDSAQPSRILGVDRSRAFVSYARTKITDPRVAFEQADAERLPMSSDSFEAVVSGLMLNAVPDQPAAVREFVRVAKPGGVVATYLWDFDGEMQVLRYFWDAAKALDPLADAASDDDQAFAISKPDRLKSVFETAGLCDVEVRALDVPAHFRDFDDYWAPLQRGHAPSQEHVAALSDVDRSRLRDLLRTTLPTKPDGSIELIARAWAAKGRKA
ncbi:MAG TPA: class I SAM-dependent methyltransferase [Candidatus Eremiobacteraceae bacterium]|nr:class I SAM-dependent methyltransferase [Candidatus Eremiobacteraceae bacterium]